MGQELRALCACALDSSRFTPSRSTLDHTQDGGAEVFSSSLVALRQAAMLVRASAALRRGLPRNLHSGGGDIRAAAVCFPLSHRALLSLQGPETVPFLQGLLTNDVTPFAEVGGAAPRALYAHALNVQGRCLYDVIAYRCVRCAQPGEPWADCELSSSTAIGGRERWEL